MRAASDEFVTVRSLLTDNTLPLMLALDLLNGLADQAVGTSVSGANPSDNRVIVGDTANSDMYSFYSTTNCYGFYPLTGPAIARGEASFDSTYSSQGWCYSDNEPYLDIALGEPQQISRVWASLTSMLSGGEALLE